VVTDGRRRLPRLGSSAGTSASAHHAKRAKATQHEPPIYRSQANLVSFDSGTYTATITLARSPDAPIGSVPVSRAISSGTMVVGSVLAVIFFDHHNNADAMIVGVY